MKKWHWRDLMCFLKIKFSRNGYVVQEMCGRCNKCNGIFAATGVIPCPMRWLKDDEMDVETSRKEGIEELTE